MSFSPVRQRILATCCVATWALMWTCCLESHAENQAATDGEARSEIPMRSLSQPMVIQTDVLANHPTEPDESHVTIFTDDKIYDFRTRPERMTIAFDRTSRRFQIARSNPPMQTSLTADDLIRFSAQLQTKALKSSDSIVRFAASPKFEETYDAERGTLVLNSKPWKYHVEVQPIADAETGRRYRDFSDWFTYLNAMFRPLPPGARLELNRTLDQHQVMPTEVQVVVQHRKTKITQRSQHRWKYQIDPKEQSLLDHWVTEQQTLPIVDFAKFRAVRTETAQATTRAGR